MMDITLEEVKAKLKTERAINYLKGYEPGIENSELFPEMLDNILHATISEVCADALVVDDACLIGHPLELT